MKKKTTRIISMVFVAMLMLALQTSAQPTVITQWDFNNDDLIPTIGNGTAVNIGGTTYSFAAGVTGNPDRGWNTSTYPEQETNSGTAGVMFMVSTLGYNNIVVEYQHRSSGTGSRWSQIEYTLNGGSSWTVLTDNDGGLSPHDTYYPHLFNFSSISGANNNPNFGIRIVSIFSPQAFNQNATLSYGANEAYMRANVQATYPPEPGVGTGNYGTGGTWRFDDVIFIGEEITGSTPVKLAVIEVNNNNSPSTNTPFSVVVQAQDADNLPSNVTSNTNIQLSRAAGSGNLGGLLTGTIPAGEHTITIQGATYNTAESGVSITATRTSGMTLSPGTSAPFTVLAAANQLTFVGFPGFGQVSTNLPAFTVEARRTDNTVDLNFTGTITLSKLSGPGSLSGTLEVNAVAGVAAFIDLQFDEAGDYTLQADASGLPDAVSTVITIIGSPTLESVILPRYMQGINGSNNDRLPFAYRATISNLIPNATYKYINQVVTSTDGPTTNGAGNIIFITPEGDFVRATSTNFANPGQHYEFTANANGSFTGWFVNEPTGNARFEPGNHVFMRIRINDGANGVVALNYLTTADSVKIINFGTESDPNQGTGVYGKYFSQGKNFAFLYDNVAGTDRPITGTLIEDDGTSGGTNYPEFYQNLVDAQEGSWGAIIPNQLPNGVRRVEVRSRTTGAIVEGTATTPNGAWPYGNNTVNPVAGTDAILITPWPDFMASQTVIAPGTTVNFSDLTLGNPTSWAWQFPGGTPGTSTVQNPAVAYYNTGEFDVTLTVTTEFGTETVVKTEYILVNPLPWPDFSADVTIVAVGGSVEFTDLSTGEPTAWQWNFEGGTPATFSGQNPPAVIYNTAGTFDVSLVVTNQWGSNTLTKEQYIAAGHPPVADFEADQTGIIEGTPVVFTDLSTHNPTTWEWTFEGGNPASSTSQNPTVTYNTPGTFNVSLKVTNQFGDDILTKNDYITVNPVGVSDFSKSALSLWPNPGTGLVNLVLPENNMLVKVYNFSGILVYQTLTATANEVIDLSHLSRGIYMLECSSKTSDTILRGKVILK
jgi:PKD repeat protein